MVEVRRWLSDLKDKESAIADAGRELIQVQHTVKALGRQLAAAFAALAEGRFAGSRRVDGRFHLRSLDGSETSV